LYDVSNFNITTGENITSTDSLYIATETPNAFTFGVNDNMIANGTINSLLTSGSLTRTETTLSLDGDLALPQELADFIDFELMLNTIVLYDVQAGIGTELSTTTNTVTQMVGTFPVTITYTLTTTAQEFLESYTLLGQNYTNVATADLILTLEAATNIDVGGVSIPLPILNEQDVLVSTNFFAKDVGLIRAVTTTEYEIDPTAVSALEAAGVMLGVPTTSSSFNTQELTSFSLEQ